MNSMISHLPYKAGSIINQRYVVMEVFPPGGMAFVYKVSNIRTKQVLALKACRSKDESSKRRFEREVRVMKRIEHPNVLQIVQRNFNHDPPYFTMPLAKMSLQDMIGNGPFDTSEAITAFESICAGLEAIHNAGAVHRDIKPSNILVMDDNRIVLADLGLAKLEHRDTTILTETRVLVGTEAYSAPEQKLPEGSREADVRTDIFQLGKTLYALLTGKSPALPDYSDIPDGLAFIIKRCTKEQPDDRYQSVAKVLDAVAMYKTASDPHSNPTQVFYSLLESTEDALRRSRIKPGEISKVLGAFLSVADSDHTVVRELFDAFSDDFIAESLRKEPAEFEQCLIKYCKSIEKCIASEPFHYAENVANRMLIVFQNGQTYTSRMLAVQATLIAAHDLNRYAAMSVFDNMIKNIDNNELAMLVADMLMHQKRRYRHLADRVPGSYLNGAIRHVRAKVINDES